MRHWRVGDIMTTDVAVVTTITAYKAIADLLVERSVSAVPVIDADSRVLGVVSETDLLAKLEYADEPPRHPLLHRRYRAGLRKAAGDTAADLMSAPAITTSADTTVAGAARQMDAGRVKRLPVVDADGRLIGIVSRRDLVRLYTRSDSDLRTDIVQDVLPALWIDSGTVEVEVTEGIVTLRGVVDRTTSAELIETFARTMPGVVDVVNGLRPERDDGTLSGR
jgi:CBS domain-containing protein